MGMYADGIRKNEPNAEDRVLGPIPFRDLDGNLVSGLTFLTGSGEVEILLGSGGSYIASTNNAFECDDDGTYLLQATQPEVNGDTIVKVRLIKAGYPDQTWSAPIVDHTPVVDASSSVPSSISPPEITSFRYELLHGTPDFYFFVQKMLIDTAETNPLAGATGIIESHFTVETCLVTDVGFTAVDDDNHGIVEIGEGWYRIRAEVYGRYTGFAGVAAMQVSYAPDLVPEGFRSAVVHRETYMVGPIVATVAAIDDVLTELGNTPADVLAAFKAMVIDPTGANPATWFGHLKRMESIIAGGLTITTEGDTLRFTWKDKVGATVFTGVVDLVARTRGPSNISASE